MTTPKAGDRLRCGACGTEIIVVKAPAGEFACCGDTMGPRDAAGSET